MQNTIAPPQIGWRVPAAWLTLCVVWSSTWLAIKVGLRDLPPVSFVALRFLIAIAVLLAVSVGRVPLLPVRRSDYTILAGTGVLMFAVNYALLFWAELHVSSGLAAVLQATIPIFGMLFAHWMLPDEPLRWQRLVGALIAALIRGDIKRVDAKIVAKGAAAAFATVAIPAAIGALATGQMNKTAAVQIAACQALRTIERAVK